MILTMVLQRTSPPLPHQAPIPSSLSAFHLSALISSPLKDGAAVPGSSGAEVSADLPIQGSRW